MVCVRRAAIAATTVAVFLTLAGCSVARDESAKPPIAEKDRDRYVMPLDAFADKERANTDYAENLFVSDCFADRGLSLPINRKTVKEDGNASWNAVSRLIFDVSTAKRFGYHQQVGEGGLSEGEVRRLYEEPKFSEHEQSEFLECLGKARQTLGTEEQIEQYATELAVDAYDATGADQQVKLAEKRWHACMVPLGISDLSPTPVGMPSDSLSAEFDLDGDILPTEFASAKEIRIATRDAECQESSGYAKTIYDTEWAFQEKLVEKNADKLLRVKAQIDAKNARVHEYIAEHAPSK